jgi:hypothetical protein
VITLLEDPFSKLSLLGSATPPKMIWHREASLEVSRSRSTLTRISMWSQSLSRCQSPTKVRSPASSYISSKKIIHLKRALVWNKSLIGIRSATSLRITYRSIKRLQLITRVTANWQMTRCEGQIRGWAMMSSRLSLERMKLNYFVCTAKNTLFDRALPPTLTEILGRGNMWPWSLMRIC